MQLCFLFFNLLAMNEKTHLKHVSEKNQMNFRTQLKKNLKLINNVLNARNVIGKILITVKRKYLQYHICLLVKTIFYRNTCSTTHQSKLGSTNKISFGLLGQNYKFLKFTIVSESHSSTACARIYACSKSFILIFSH